MNSLRKIALTVAIMMPLCLSAMDKNKKEEITQPSSEKHLTLDQLITRCIIGSLWRNQKPTVSEYLSSIFEKYELVESAQSAIKTRSLTIIKNPDGGMACHEHTTIELKPQGKTSWTKKHTSINAAKEIMCVEEESSDYNPGRTRMIMGSGLHEDPVFDLWRDSNRGKSDH